MRAALAVLDPKLSRLRALLAMVGAGGGGGGLLPSASRLVYVNKGGSDSSGNGTIGNPYATIPHAYDTITDAADAKRYAILVGPGQYAESFDFKPWVGLCNQSATGASNGTEPDGESLVEVQSPTGSIHFDPSWGTVFADAWFAGIGFSHAQAFNESDVAGCKPQLNFLSCVMNGDFDAGPGVNIQSPGNVGTNNYLFESCLIYNGATARGTNFFWTRNTTFLGGTVLIQAGPSPTANSPTRWLAQGCSIGAATSPTNVHLLWDASSPVGATAMGDFSNAPMVGVLTLDGAHVSSAFNDCGPPSGVVIVNGAPVPVWNQFSPAVLANWNNVAPFSLANALDRISAKIGPIP
jgi:hypothetical protein